MSEEGRTEKKLAMVSYKIFISAMPRRGEIPLAEK